MKGAILIIRDEIRVEYIDNNGHDIILVQDNGEGSLSVYARSEEDFTIPFGKTVKKGEFVLEFQQMINKKSLFKNEQELVVWYNKEYLINIKNKHFDERVFDELL